MRRAGRPAAGPTDRRPPSSHAHRPAGRRRLTRLIAAASVARADRVPDRLGLQGGEHPVKARLGLQSAFGEADHALEVPAAATARSSASAPGAPARSIAFTSWWAASQGAISATSPVSTFTTPPAAARRPEPRRRPTASSGYRSLATTTAVLPPDDRGREHADQPEQGAVLRREHRHHAGRLGHDDVDERARHRVDAAADLGDLVRPAGVPGPAVHRRVHLGVGGVAASRRWRGRPGRRTGRGDRR